MDDYKVNEPLPLKGTRNVRELGGYPTEDGKTTKDKVFLRADNLKKLTKKGRNYLYDYGVRLVIALRSDAEIKRGADKIDTVSYTHLAPVCAGLLRRMLRALRAWRHDNNP